MTIRGATARDFAQVIACDPIAATTRRRSTFLARRIQAGECWVYESDDDILGFAILEYTFYDYGFVPLLCVAEGARRRGVGRALMRHILTICATPKLFTSTNQSNQPMQSLLAACGFAPSGVIDNLDANDPELVFWHPR